mmetsp:Transcript_21607/g.53929  ORF Transcript_21607/g.53929 Transcript_21607/m.53929 type:complete len:90 (+) Transcript_21607:192-461(+)
MDALCAIARRKRQCIGRQAMSLMRGTLHLHTYTHDRALHDANWATPALLGAHNVNHCLSLRARLLAMYKSHVQELCMREAPRAFIEAPA